VIKELQAEQVEMQASSKESKQQLQKRHLKEQDLKILLKKLFNLLIIRQFKQENLKSSMPLNKLDLKQ
jgi:hypothetical protein